jgi:hypothetical protein
VLMVRVMCPNAGMTPVLANMTRDTPPDYRCTKCGNTGHTKYEARGRGAALVIEDAKAPKRKKFKKGGKSKGKKKGGKGGDAKA